MFIQKCSHKTNSGDKGSTPTCEKMIEPLSVHAKEGMSKSRHTLLNMLVHQQVNQAISHS